MSRGRFKTAARQSAVAAVAALCFQALPSSLANPAVCCACCTVDEQQARPHMAAVGVLPRTLTA